MPTTLLYGGENLFGLSVIPTPGHTFGSISYLNGKHKLLFSGDVTICYPNENKLPGDFTFQLEYITLQMTDNVSLQMQLDSLNMLSGLNSQGLFNTILPGHKSVQHGKNVQPYIQNSIGIITQILAMI